MDMDPPATSFDNKQAQTRSEGPSLKHSSLTASTSTTTTHIAPLSTPKLLLGNSTLHGVESTGATEHRSAFLPYRPHATVLTNLQRGNTEATFCPVEEPLSFHERAGQGEITEEQIQRELAHQKELKSSIDFKDSFGFTPLHWACFYGQLATVKLLVGVGANVNAEAPEMVTPLLLAACGGHNEVVSLLLDHDADSTHMDIVGNTALMYAAAGNHPHTCNELLAKDPDMTPTNEDGQSAYSLAVENGAVLAQAVIEQYMSALLSI